MVVARMEPLVDDFLTLRFDICFLTSSKETWEKLRSRYLIFGKYSPVFLTLTWLLKFELIRLCVGVTCWWKS